LLLVDVDASGGSTLSPPLGGGCFDVDRFDVLGGDTMWTESRPYTK